MLSKKKDMTLVSNFPLSRNKNWDFEYVNGHSVVATSFYDFCELGLAEHTEHLSSPSID